MYVALGLAVILSACSEPVAQPELTEAEPPTPTTIELEDNELNGDLFVEAGEALIADQIGDREPSFEHVGADVEKIRQLAQRTLDCTTSEFDSALPGSFTCAPSLDIERMVVVLRLEPAAFIEDVEVVRNRETPQGAPCVIGLSIGDDTLIMVRTPNGFPNDPQSDFIDELRNDGGVIEAECGLGDAEPVAEEVETTTTSLPPMTPLEQAVYESTGQLPGEGNVEVVIAPGVVADMPADFWIEVLEESTTCHTDLPPRFSMALPNSFTCITEAEVTGAVFAISTANSGEVDEAVSVLRNDDPNGICWPIVSHGNWVFAFGVEQSAGFEALVPAMNVVLAIDGAILQEDCAS